MFKKISLVPFVKNGGIIKVLSNKMPFQKTAKYNFPTMNIAYEDIPKKLNANEDEVINIEEYYANQQGYISKIFDNTIKRIISYKLNDLVKLDSPAFKQLNAFKPKVYEDFFNKSTNTFVILVECKEEFEYKEWKFNELIPQQS